MLVSKPVTILSCKCIPPWKMSGPGADLLPFVRAVPARLMASWSPAHIQAPDRTLTPCHVPLQRKVLDQVQAFLDLPKDAANREEFVKDLRLSTNGWVAKYRRRNSISGRPSFGCAHFLPIALADRGILLSCMSYLPPSSDFVRPTMVAAGTGTPTL